jgi:hypothetical protein
MRLGGGISSDSAAIPGLVNASITPSPARMQIASVARDWLAALDDFRNWLIREAA